MQRYSGMTDPAPEPGPYAPTVAEPPTVSSGHGSAFLLQALAVSVGFWTLASLGAVVAVIRSTEGFLHYLRFSSTILLGLILFGGSTLGNRITTMGADKWGMGHGRYGYEKDYGDGGGLTSLGILVVLAPQVGLAVYLIS